MHREMTKPFNLSWRVALCAVAFLIATQTLMGQQIDFRAYLPLKDGLVKTFSISTISTNGQAIDPPALSVCKSIQIEEKEIFYFSEDLGGTSPDVGPNLFCHGAVYFEEGKFMVAPVFWKNDFKTTKLSNFEMHFPNPVEFETPYNVVRLGKEKRSYIFGPFETISIGTRDYENCLKLTIIQDWPYKQYTDIVWFQKGVGVVKWFRGTGRMEEILE
jgi:hypothetical protein